MSTDVAIVGLPFLDITFEGMPRLPGVGEELVARSLHMTPGGTAMQAIGAARLGLATALIAPLGGCGAARLVRERLSADGVEIVGSSAEQGDALPVTALLSTPQGVAMASVLEGREPGAADVALPGARAVVLSLGRLELAPPRTKVYAVTGSLELERVSEQTLSGLCDARALVLNAVEAAALTGESDPEQAALRLARHGAAAVVTLGAEGVLAAVGDEVFRAHAPDVEAVDATGAGDMFVAAFVWADLMGAAMASRLAWASLYAGLSVRAPTALEGALSLEALLDEGDSRGLDRPPSVEAHRGRAIRD